MTDAEVSVSPTSAPPATIHEAERGAGPSGAVLRGSEIDLALAIARRRG